MKSIPKHTLTFINSWLTLRQKWETYPGFVVAIAKDGKLLFNNAYGLANLEDNIPMTPDHVFRIASHSKTFTATAIMQLHESGKLQLDDLAVSYLPWLQRHKDERWKTVTLRQLMSHSAGVVRDGLDANYWRLQRDFPNDEQLKAEILNADLVLDPNTKLKYSNYGYSLLGQIVEKVSGTSYADYVTERIITALELTRTTSEYNNSLNTATGYTREMLNRQRIAFPHISTHAMAAATGFCSTAADLVTYFSAHMVGSDKLLSDVSKREMQHGLWNATGRIDNESYGLGIGVTTRKGRTLIGHGGGFPGFMTQSYFDPKDKLVVVVLTNANGTWPMAMAKALFDIIDELGDEQPKVEHLKYEGRFVSLHGMCEIIANCKGLRAIYPNSWRPLDTVDTLEVIDDTTLEISETGSYDNIGETIRYEFGVDGRPKSIMYGGIYMPVSEDGNLIKTW